MVVSGRYNASSGRKIDMIVIHKAEGMLDAVESVEGLAINF